MQQLKSTIASIRANRYVTATASPSYWAIPDQPKLPEIQQALVSVILLNVCAEQADSDIDDHETHGDHAAETDAGQRVLRGTGL